jgi:hypothetical protein
MKKFLLILILVTALVVSAGGVVSADPGGDTRPSSTETTDV